MKPLILSYIFLSFWNLDIKVKLPNHADGGNTLQGR